MTRILLAAVLVSSLNAAQPFYDRTYPSKVFGEERHYRIFLPRDYENTHTHYPVAYYFHGHSDRYTLEGYDHGLDTVPKIAAFVASHPIIVVAPDGYVASHYTGFYGGDPYDIRRDGGDVDYGNSFLELVRHVDANYRTLTSRRYRATSGLSMGGFMSLYLSARYPDIIGSASAFNPGPEFYVGEKGRRSLWRPKDHVLDHEHTMIRLIRASGDFISQYHEETREAYAITPSVDFEFRQDEYHRHWATSIGETLEFHLRAFTNPALDTIPATWNYSSANASFDVHDYRLQSNLSARGIIYLDHVSQGGFGIRTRKWAPDGPAADCSSVILDTAPLYHRGSSYHVVDLKTGTQKVNEYDVVANNDGRLQIHADCSAHEIGLNGPGTGAQPLVFLRATEKDFLRLPPEQIVSVPVRLFNPKNSKQTDVQVKLTSAYPIVEVLRGKSDPIEIAPGGVADLTKCFQIQLTSGEDAFDRARLTFTVDADNAPEEQHYIDLLITPENIPAPLDMAILDGRTETFNVFRQKGNSGGGGSVKRTVTEGRGNGNGILEPGEQVTIWVKVRQGLDPFDKNNWRRAKLYSNSPWVSEIADIEEQKQLEWTSAQNRTSLVELSPATPPNISIPLILDSEGWTYRFTPDVRYGTEPLYQAFQLHNHQLFAWTWSRH